LPDLIVVVLAESSSGAFKGANYNSVRKQQFGALP
jgi:hypothetical protein